MKSLNLYRFLIVMISILVVLSGCSNASNTTPKSTTKDSGAAADNKVLRVGVAASLATGDPRMTGSPNDMSVLINLFDPLVRRDDKGKLQPSLATSWKLLDDKTWEFKLRTGVKFHNGEEFNSEAVKFSLESIFKEGSKSPIQELRSVESVEIVDPSTIRIHTKTLDPYIPDKLALFAGMMVPPKYVQEKGADNFSNNPVGTGPFVFKSWVKDGSLTLTSNPNYWNGVPKVSGIVFKFIPDEQSRVAALLSKDVDIINKVPATALKTIEANTNLRVDKAEGTRIYYLSTASIEGPTKDKRVRQAISYAIDTKLLISKLLGGNGVQIAAPIAGANFGSDVNLKPYPYDPNKAKQLLSEAGFSNGLELEMNTQPGIYTDIAQTIVQMLGEVGIKVNLKPLPGAEFEDKYANGKLAPLWNSGYSVWQGDPTTLIGTFFYTGMPRAKYYSKDLDKKIDSMRTNPDVNQRKTGLHEILNVLHDDAPWTYLFQENDLYGISKNVTWKIPADQLLELKETTMK